MSTPPSPVMLFGKLPTQGDFVRVNMGRGLGPELESWLGRAVEEAHGRIPESAVHLLARVGPSHRLIAGAWVPSRDAVGRAFPLAIFRDIEEELALAPMSILTTFLGPWFEGIETLARSASVTGAATAASEAASLDLGHPSAIPGALYECIEALSQLPVSELAAELYGESSSLEQLAYALVCIRKAVQLSNQPKGQPIVLDAPCTADKHFVVWLELMRHVQNAESVPCCVLMQTSPRRMLVSLGGLTETLLAFLVTPEHPSAERWPLWSSRSDGAARACAALPNQVADVLKGNGNVDSLLAALQD